MIGELWLSREQGIRPSCKEQSQGGCSSVMVKLGTFLHVDIERGKQPSSLARPVSMGQLVLRLDAVLPFNLRPNPALQLPSWTVSYWASTLAGLTSPWTSTCSRANSYFLYPKPRLPCLSSQGKGLPFAPPRRLAGPESPLTPWSYSPPRSEPAGSISCPV